MSEEVVFYLGSSEARTLSDVRKCTGAVLLPGRRSGGGYVLVQIEPPIIGQQYGLGGEDINEVVLAPRHAGVTLLPLSESPASVHVALLLKSPPEAVRGVGAEDLKALGWGEVYSTLAEAQHDARRAREPR
jgi:hypothetical protein